MAKMRRALLLGAVVLAMQAPGGVGAGATAHMAAPCHGETRSTTSAQEALTRAAAERKAFPRELLDAAKHPRGRKAVVAWLLFREVRGSADYELARKAGHLLMQEAKLLEVGRLANVVWKCVRGCVHRVLTQCRTPPSNKKRWAKCTCRSLGSARTTSLC